MAVAANGRNTHADVACRLKCVELLMGLQNNGCVIIDDGGQILAEYQGNLRPEGQPGVGDLFYRHLLDNRGNAKRVRLVATDAPRGNALRGAFERGTLAAFDHSDRVFATCAAVARVAVATALDSDWVNHETGLIACGVRLDYVCGRAVAAGVKVASKQRRDRL